MQRLLPPILVVLCAIVMLIFYRKAPLATVMPEPYNYFIGIPLMIAGLALTLYAARQFRLVRTNIKTFNRPDVLVTDGAFAWTRNPMYLGFAIALLGFAIKLNVWPAVGVAAAFALIADRWYVRFEERMAAEAFGERYEAYRRTTRRWL
jgi:protein-S-isoprenylcysteine O-methyltransferase Ste14